MSHMLREMAHCDAWARWRAKQENMSDEQTEALSYGMQVLWSTSPSRGYYGSADKARWRSNEGISTRPQWKIKGTAKAASSGVPLQTKVPEGPAKYTDTPQFQKWQTLWKDKLNSMNEADATALRETLQDMDRVQAGVEEELRQQAALKREGAEHFRPPSPEGVPPAPAAASNVSAPSSKPMEVDSAQPSFSSVAQSLDIDIKDDSSSEGHTLQGASSEILPVDSSSEGHALQGASAGSAEVKIEDQGGVNELTGRITQLIQRLRAGAANNLRSTFRQ